MNETIQNSTPPQAPSARKKRHGCLTTWLILIIIANTTVTILLAAVFAGHDIDVEGWVVAVDVLLGIWAIICAVALFKWKKWGFYGFTGGVVVSMALNFSAGNYVTAFTPLISIAVLYGVLQIGGDNKGWPQLD